VYTERFQKRHNLRVTDGRGAFLRAVWGTFYEYVVSGLRFSGLRSPKSTFYGPGSTIHGLWSPVSVLRSLVCGQRSTVCGLRSTRNGLRSTVYGLRSTMYSLGSTAYKKWQLYPPSITSIEVLRPQFKMAAFS
jgi:hypothetical protein